MTEAALEVLAAGPHVTIQDGGRPGMMRYGVPASGPLDRRSLAIANTALGNPATAPGIEVSALGLTLLCRKGPLSLAVGGGGFVLVLNGETRTSWAVLTLQTGDRLTIRPGPWGSWCCIGFAGLLQCRTWLNAAATLGSSGLGGGALTPGQTLTITDTRPLQSAQIPCPVWARPRQVFHVVPGPQDALFAPETLHDFLHSPFRLTSAYDRMGMRLAGPSLTPQGALGIPSQGMTRGAVQVAGDGIATVLMADHQTTGGYPKIATLLSDDTDALAQLRPGDSLSFAALTPAQAVAMARTRAQAQVAYLNRLSNLQARA